MTDQPKVRRIVRPPQEDDGEHGRAPTTPESERHGWGDDPADGPRGRDWYERERPPHHGE